MTLTKNQKILIVAGLAAGAALLFYSTKKPKFSDGQNLTAGSVMELARKQLEYGRETNILEAIKKEALKDPVTRQIEEQVNREHELGLIKVTPISRNLSGGIIRDSAGEAIPTNEISIIDRLKSEWSGLTSNVKQTFSSVKDNLLSFFR